MQNQRLPSIIRRQRGVLGALGGVVAAACIAPADAQAYLDPSTGSAIFQMLVATAMGSLFIIRTYWKKITMFFSGDSGEKSDASESPQVGGSSSGDDRE